MNDKSHQLYAGGFCCGSKGETWKSTRMDGRIKAAGNKMAARQRPDHDGTHRRAFERNKKIIYATQSVCGICGKPVDFSIKYPSPMSACIDHIVPIDKGGHPSDMDNLQLAHFACNRQKSNKLFEHKEIKKPVISNRDLPWSTDWTKYSSGQ